MNYRSLTAHNNACNEIFHRYQDCENEHPYRRFLGYCEHIQKEMQKCLEEQREIRRSENVKYGHGARYRTQVAEQQKNSN